MLRPLFTLLPLLAVISAAASPAAAADSTGALISRGLELRRAGKPSDALDLFRKANLLEPSPRTLGNLGLTEASLSRWVEASDHLAAAQAARSDPWTRKNRRGLDQALKMARQHVGKISVAGPTGVEVSVGGHLVGTLPLAGPVRVPQGDVAVKAVAPGYQPFEQTLSVEGGAHVPLTLALEKIPLPLQETIPLPSSPTPEFRSTTTGRPTPSLRPTESASLTIPTSYDTPSSSWRTWTGAGLLLGGASLLTWGIVWVGIDGHHGGTANGVYDTRAIGWALTSAGAAAAIGGGILLHLDRAHDSELAVAFSSSGLSVAGRF